MRKINILVKDISASPSIGEDDIFITAIKKIKKIIQILKNFDFGTFFFITFVT